MIGIQLNGAKQRFLDKITAETGRNINIVRIQDLSLPGMKIAFNEHPTDILIGVKSGISLTDPDIQRSIVHEAVHGLLIYGRGYSRPIKKRPFTRDENKTVVIMKTMVDDIVVNKIVQEEGFSPYSKVYINMLRKEIKAAHSGRDIYKDFSDNPKVKSNFKVLRYIMAWGFLEYYSLDEFTKKILNNFLSVFEKTYPSDFIMALKIKEIILNNDIFSPKGHHKILEEITHLWELDNVIEICNL